MPNARNVQPRTLQESIVRVGQRRAYVNDAYAFLLRSKWRRLIAFCGLLYLAVNALFASLYVGLGQCIDGARPDSFFDAFFFSIQTLATIGYGVMHPHGVCGHTLVGIEALVGLLGFALVTGIVFSKFARPSAGVIFSHVAVISPHDGVPCLLFRVANERGSDIVESSMRLHALMDTTTSEGKHLRRFHDLKLDRNSIPVLLMSWLVIHCIDEHSPLYGKSAEDLKLGDIRILASMTGMDGTFMQTVYAYHQYAPDSIRYGAEFEDIIRRLPDGRSELDLTKFHSLR
jgi:inward rectifier potassium channel